MSADHAAALRERRAMRARVHELAHADEQVEALLAYGSFTQGEGDAHSDIEYWVFLRNEAVDGFDDRSWVAQLRPLEAYIANEFGSQVAIFDNLVRGEFHFVAAPRLTEVPTWPLAGEPLDVDAMAVVDRRGTLREALTALAAAPHGRRDPAARGDVCHRFLNWFLLGLDVLARGERARALDALAHLHRQLLWLVRLDLGLDATHYLTPSRALEQELPPDVYRRFAATTAGVAPGALEGAYLAAWGWGRELIVRLRPQAPVEPTDALLEKIDRRVGGQLGSCATTVRIGP